MLIDNEIVSILNYTFPGSTVVISTPTEYKGYADQIVETLNSGGLMVRCVAVVDYDNFENADVYISSSLIDMYKFRSIYDKVFVGDMFRSAIFYLLGGGDNHVKNKYLYGLLTIFISLFPVWYFVIISTLYLMFVKNINHVMVNHLLFSCVFCAFFKILRELLQIVDEWGKYNNGFEPRSSKPFIDCSSSVLVATLYCVALFVSCIFLLFKDSSAALLAMITGVLYYSSYNMKFVFRVVFALMSSGCIWLLNSYVL